VPLARRRLRLAAAEFIGEINSPAEGRGFEPSVPHRIDDALESTVRYLGIEVDDALSISEQVEL
jgi:hypothetical protein